jgi:hypothetical protein
VSDLQTAAMAPPFLDFDTAVSVLIFIIPTGGAIHWDPAVSGFLPFSSSSVEGAGARSSMNRLMSK